MKPFVPAVIALVAGIALGAWQPRGELLRAREEIDQLRASANKPCRGATADRIRTILRAEPPREDEGNVADDAPLPEDEVPDAPGGANEAEGPEVPSIEAVTDQMRATMNARRAQAMAALVEQAQLDDEQVTDVNHIMDDMNAQLEQEVDRFVDEAVARGDVDRRDIMDFAAESLDIVIATDDRMRGSLGDTVYGEVDDSALDPLSYLSGDTLDALTRLQDIPGLED